MNKNFVIALTDDDPDEHLLFKETLEEIIPQHTLISYMNGRHLLTDLKNNQLPDLLFLDINMPFINGFDTLKLIKEWWSALPVIILSASRNEDDMRKSYFYGADLYVTKSHEKPFGELISKIIGTVQCGKKINRVDFPSNIHLFNKNNNTKFMMRELDLMIQLITKAPLRIA
jgi:CheY-like chemotaxis protein